MTDANSTSTQDKTEEEKKDDMKSRLLKTKD